MLRVTTRVLAVGALCLLVAASGRDRLQAAGEPGRDGPKVATAGQLIISEFRLRGPNGASDEFIEIYNHTETDHTVAALTGTGYGIAASDGVTRCSIPNGTVIPSRGHYLCVNSTAYSLASYPAGSGTTATGDASYTTDIPDNAGIAVFNNNTGGSDYSLANRLDAAGSTSEVNTLYREGAGYPPLVGSLDIDASFTRRLHGGCSGSSGGANCGNTLLMQVMPGPISNLLTDFNNNATDFLFVDTNGTSAGAGQRLGAPGPENLSSPISRDLGPGPLAWSRLDTCTGALLPPNKIRDLTSDPPNNSSLGTFELRRTWTNNTGVSLTRLRFRIVDVSTFPSLPGVADFRPRTSADTVVTVDRFPCGSGTSNVTVRGTTLEQPPSQPNGSGYNGTLSVAAVTPGTPLANGASIDVRFLLGVMQAGIGRFCVVAETLPSVAGHTFCFIGHTESNIQPHAGDYDFDFDQRADIAVVNPATRELAILQSEGGTFNTLRIVNWGGDGYTPVQGDFDGDGRLETAAYKRSTASWVMRLSATAYSGLAFFSWGGEGFDAAPGDYDGDQITDVAVYSAASSNWQILTSTSGFTSSLSISWGGPGYTAVPGQDVDGDGRSDLVIYNERLGTWYALRSSTNFTTALTKAWGGSGYTLVPGDYDGDGKTDFGLYARATGYWYVLQSSSNYTSSMAISFGGPGFVPVPGDFDGDGRTDIGIYQKATNRFMVLTSSSGYSPGSAFIKTFGLSGESALTTAIVPANSREIDGGDADGDFTSDLTVYNTTTGVWSTLHSTGGFATATNIGWGGTGYTPVPGDYDGDGRRDLGLYQPSTGNWLVLLSSSNFTTTLAKSAGGAGYVPVQGDYDGDGKTDFAVYNAATGLWFGLKSSTNYTTALAISWGGGAFVAAPGDFDGDGKQDLAAYNTATGDWAILTSSSNYTSSIARNFGGAGYAPVQADFDGDGITDFAVYQASIGVWSFLKSTSGNTLGATIPFGGAGYTPVAGDWDGDRCADIGVYSTTGAWSILLSNSGYRTSLSKSWGGSGYTPVPTFP